MTAIGNVPCTYFHCVQTNRTKVGTVWKQNRPTLTEKSHCCGESGKKSVIRWQEGNPEKRIGKPVGAGDWRGD